MTSHIILQHIASILSFENNKAYLKDTFKGYQDTDWINFVKIGSEHLVLPSIYCRLQQQNLLEVLPDELSVYLRNLTEINRNRNNTISIQVTSISNLFKEHHINHTFLKGIALMMGNYYHDFGERMIGDIDILVATNQLELTTQLLKELQYKTRPKTFGDFYILRHQLPRFIPDNHGIAAVEIHRHLLHRYNNQYLETDKILSNKTHSSKLVFIPSEPDLINHTVLNFEINDNGYLFNKLLLRSAYDFTYLSKKIKGKSLLKLTKISKFHKHFIWKTAYYFQNLKTYNLKKTTTVKSVMFKISKKYHVINRAYHIIATIIHDTKHILRLLDRVYLFLFNKGYRKAAWNDRLRIIRLLKKKLISLD